MSKTYSFMLETFLKRELLTRKTFSGTLYVFVCAELPGSGPLLQGYPALDLVPPSDGC